MAEIRRTLGVTEQKKIVVLTDYNDEAHIIKIDNSQERLLNWHMKKDIVDFEIKEFQDIEVEEI